MSETKPKLKIAILGAGNIASRMAEAITGIPEEVEAYAVASRNLEKAKAFAKRWGFRKAYGSYEEMVNDPDVELVYVATPHSHHYAHAKLCLEHGKPALVEKAFTGNAQQAQELIHLSQSSQVFLCEAMWTRFLPAVQIVKDLLDSGAIGRAEWLEGEFSIPLMHVKRMRAPALAGGALLDLGVYVLTFASMYFGDDIVDVSATCLKFPTGVDGSDIITYTYRDGRIARLRTSFLLRFKNEGMIHGTDGKICVKTLNNYTSIRLLDSRGKLRKEYPIPLQVNGYEYEVLAAKAAIQAGQLECTQMPHAKTMEIMRQMDALRQKWGVRYPFDEWR